MWRRGARARRVQLLLEVVELRRVVGIRRRRHREALPLEAGPRPAHGRRQRLPAHPHVAAHAALHTPEVGPAHGVGAGVAEVVARHLGRRVEAGGVVRHPEHAAGRAHDAAHAAVHVHAAGEVLDAFTAVHLHGVRDSLQEVQAGGAARARVAGHLRPRR